MIDERRARRIAAQVYGLAVKGTAGILVEAKRAGIVSKVRPLLEDMLPSSAMNSRFDQAR
ncbi:MAG TPA: DUF3368 domain-containing protein [Thermoanaerobaculia bacterium]|nr:DUF3368 domain-containing protein [Thermoanaerobaculia bacterium]